MLCYKDGRTAHLITRCDCNQPNNAVIWGTKGLIEVCTLVCLVLPVINLKILQFIRNVNGDIVSYTSNTPKFKKVILPSNTSPNVNVLLNNDTFSVNRGRWRLDSPLQFAYSLQLS